MVVPEMDYKDCHGCTMKQPWWGGGSKLGCPSVSPTTVEQDIYCLLLPFLS